MNEHDDRVLSVAVMKDGYIVGYVPHSMYLLSVVLFLRTRGKKMSSSAFVPGVVFF